MIFIVCIRRCFMSPVAGGWYLSSALSIFSTFLFVAPSGSNRATAAFVQGNFSVIVHVSR